MFFALIGVVALFVAWRVMSRPFLGLLLMLAVNPIEGLIPLPHGLSAGRLVSVVTVLGWVAYLRRHPAASTRLRQGKVFRRVWPFLIICFLGVLFNGASDVRSYSNIVSLILLALMSVMVENLVDSQRKLRQLAMVVALSSVVAAAFPIAYHFGIDPYTPLGVEAAQTVEAGRAVGLVRNANAMGLACSMGLFALLILIVVQRRLLVTLALVFLGMAMVGGLILSGSRTHLVAVSVCALIVGGLGVFGPRGARAVTGVAAGVVIVLLLVAFAQAPDSIQNRLILIGDDVDQGTFRRASFAMLQLSHAVGLLWENPLLGVGLKNFHFPARTDAHDTVSALVGETGLLGVFSFIWLIVPCWKSLCQAAWDGRRYRDRTLYLYSVGFIAAFTAMFVAGLGGYVIFYQRWFWITLGAAGGLAQWAKIAEFNHVFSVTRSNEVAEQRRWDGGRPSPAVGFYYGRRG